MIYENLWGSMVNFCNELNAGSGAEYIDWEAHANIMELPNADLVGTTALTFTEDEAGLFSISVAIGVSTYTNDEQLFRLRKIVGAVFSRLRVGMKIAYHHHETLEQLGWLHIVDGTMVMPMTRADVRPLQFVQVHAVMDAVTAEG